MRALPLRGAAARRHRGAGARARAARRHAHGDGLAEQGARRDLRPRRAARRPRLRGGARTSPPASCATAPTCRSSSACPRRSELRDVFVVAGDAQEPRRVRGRRGAARRSRGARPPVRRDRDHGVPGEPSADRRRDDDPRDVREGAARDLHHEPGLLRSVRDGRVDRGRVGARDATAGLRRRPGGRLARQADARLDADRDRRLAPLPPQARVRSRRASCAAASRPTRWSTGSARCWTIPTASSPASTSSRSTTSRTPSAGAASGCAQEGSRERQPGTW